MRGLVNKIQKLLLLLILAVALLVRMLFSVAVVGVSSEPRGDEIDYMSIAGNVAAGNGFCADGQYCTARRPPLYPLFLAAWFKTAGTSIVLGRVLQWLLGTLIVYLVFLLGRKVYSASTALLAAFATACNPFLIFISAYILTENLYIVLVLLFLFWCPGFNRENAYSPKSAVLCGFLLGVATLCRPTAFFMWIFVVAGILVFTRERVRIRLRNSVLFGLVLLCTLMPWAWRNNQVFGTWILFTTHGGITFYQSNNQAVLDNPQYYGSVAPLYSLPEYDRLKTLDEVTKDKESWRLGKQFLRENPRLVPVLVSRKFQRLWRFKSDVGMSGIRSGWWWDKNRALGKLASHFDAGIIYALLVIPLFVFGLIVTFRLYTQLLLWYGVIIVHTLLVLVFFGSLRARLPLEPLVAIFAAAGLLKLLGRLRSTDPGGSSTSYTQGG